MAAIDPLTAGAVLLATAATDAVYVMFTSAVAAVASKTAPAVRGSMAAIATPLEVGQSLEKLGKRYADAKSPRNSLRHLDLGRR